MKTDINIYLITSEHLKIRFNHLNHQIVKLKGIFDKLDINYNFIQINTPTNKEIENAIDKYKERVNLNKDEITDDDFKNLITPLNTNQLSNFSKQQKALEMIKNSNVKINYIIEDDIMIIDEFIDNFIKLLEKIKTLDFDILLTAIAINDTTNEDKFLNSYDCFKVLIAKSSYFITNKCAEKLFEYLNKIKFTYKLSLSHFIWENKKDIKSFVYNKNLLFEGSKIGLFTSNTNSNNFLYQNGEYIKLTQIVGNNEYIEDSVVKQAESIYNSSGKNNPDFQHTMGLIYYKNKDYKRAKEMLIDAVLNLKKADGYISQQNETLNNCINMHQFEQSDIDNVLKLNGVYS
jgi:hypothetical protein